jgi:hypothetical protein
MNPELKEHCLVKNDGVDDVRNGILLCRAHHTIFDSVLYKPCYQDSFTIVFENDKYYIAVIGETPDTLKTVHEILIPSSKERPGPEFLKCHNNVFSINLVIFD